MNSLRVNGLVLSGGYSRRMGQDKAALCIDEQPMLTHAWQLLNELCDSVWVSARADQQDPLRQRYPLIIDQVADCGPLAGIAAAQAHEPAAAWLVIACDMPRLQADTLQPLVTAGDAAFSAGQQAVVMRNPQGHLEPLCALWLPASQSAVNAALAARHLAVGKLLESMSIHCIDCGDQDQLSNINQTADLSRLVGSSRHRVHKPQLMTASIQITVQYFAIFRELAGCRQEVIQSTAADADALYQHLAAHHGFKLATEQLKVAINGEFSTWQQPLRAGDVVTFIPPVAGG